MYRNSGAAIKVLATVLAVLMMIGCVASGVYLIVEEEEIGYGLAAILGGCFASWLICLMLAAFGELVNNTHKILKLLKVMSQEKPVVVMPQPVVESVPAPQIDYSAPVQKNEAPVAAPVQFEQPANVTSCPTCGAPRKGNNAFCAFCGTKF